MVAFFGKAGHSYYLTYEFSEQLVGFPQFSIAAPEGTIIELIVQESHTPHGPIALLDTGFYCWSRFTCRAGRNDFRCFDFESLKWLQLHITMPSDGEVCVDRVGVLRRRYPFSWQPVLEVKDPLLQRLFDAGFTTLYNAAIETLVDGMGRERQQYSGDGAHVMLTLRRLMGDAALCRRFLYTYSDGLTPSGYFLDCYPAIDRLRRISYMQIGLSVWGPLIDHSVGFVGDCHKYAIETGDFDTVRDIYPRLNVFVDFLLREAGDDLFPVEGRDYCVWLDHEAYEQQRHRLASMNCYIYGMLRMHWVPLMCALGKESEVASYEAFADRLRERLIERFWDPERRMFFDNLPWIEEEKTRKVSDRTLAMAILYDLCPKGDSAVCGEYLAHSPDLKLSYPCNAVWRQWALGKLGYVDVILQDLRDRWATMDSVRFNHTYQEFWTVPTDSTAEFSHVPQAPLLAVTDVLVGIEPTVPGYRDFSLCPQLGNIGALHTVITTAAGPVDFTAESDGTGSYQICIRFGAGRTGRLKTFGRNTVRGLKKIKQDDTYAWYLLKEGSNFSLQYVTAKVADERIST